MKHLFIIVIAAFVLACTPDKPVNVEETPEQSTTKSAVEEVIANPTKGIGAVKHVTLKTPLEVDRVDRGLAIYEMKCSACHKLTEDRIVGPGWKGVTTKR